MSDRTSGIYNDVLELVGNTPVVRLNRVKGDLECELLAKLEFLNPGGSVKDRIGRKMLDDAIAINRVKPGDTMVEPTSGNTGIGLAMACAVRGYNCVITLPQKMSNEKVSVLKSLGAEVIRTPTEAAWDAPDSHIGVANTLVAENKETHHCLDQYTNTSNPDAHTQTANEILRQCDGKLDMIVISAGTGGTLTGVARRLKEVLPNIKVVAVDPHGSLLHNDAAPIHTYDVEGIGYDFVPKVCERQWVDEWIVTEDAESFAAARRLIKEEGLLVGGSCGAALVGALKAAKSLKAGQRCLVILPDSVRNYLTKYINDEWMYERGHLKRQKTE